MPKKSQLRCYFGCKKDGPLHIFPNPNNSSLHAVERFNSWKSILPKQIQERGNTYICNSIRICNRHFMKCYCLPSNRLTQNAVPTLFLEHKGESSKELADPTDPLDQPIKDFAQEEHESQGSIIQEDNGSQGPILQEELGSQGPIVQEELESQGYIEQEIRSQGSIVQEELESQGFIEQEEIRSQAYIIQELGSQGSIVQEELESQGYIEQEEIRSQAYIIQELESEGHIEQEDHGSQGSIVQEEFGSQGHIEQGEDGSDSEDNTVLQPTNSEVYHFVIDMSESDSVLNFRNPLRGPLSSNNNRNTRKGSPKCYGPKHSKNKTVKILKRKLENRSEKYTEMFTLYSKEQEMRFKELKSSMEAISKKNDELIKRISTLEKDRKADRVLIKELEEKVEKLERRGSSFEIQNVAQKHESKETLCTKVMELGKIFNIDIDCSTIKDIYRFKTKD